MRRGSISFALLAAAASVACVPSALGRTAPDPGTRAATVAAIDSMLRQPEFRNAHWGILIVDPVRADTIYSWNAGKLFMPASNMKLITGAVALEKLGPEFRFRTFVAARGTLADSVLRGDLLVHGRGDPSISESMRKDSVLTPLLAIADSLAARGIRRITGRLAAGADAFSDAPWGYGWSWDDFDFAYSAGVDELFLNEGFARLRIRGADTAGGAPAVTVHPLGTYPPVRVTATTIARSDSARTRLRVATDGAGPGVVLSGQILTGDTTSRAISYRDQRVAYLSALAEVLRSRGITVVGGIDTTRAVLDSLSADTSSRGNTLFAVESPPLREILPIFEKPSQNQIGEILLKTLGLEFTGVGTADSGRRVVDSTLVSWGADTAEFAVRDGSGLSRHNYVTPNTLIRVLDQMRRSPNFQVYYDALPVAGVDGTIERRMRGTLAEGNVRAKTGTIDKARSLSGYVTTRDGRLLLFSLLCNNYTVSTAWPTRMQDSIAARLAGLHSR